MTEGFQPHWFGEYELLRLLGVGGMAEVYLARTTRAHGFRKLVVVKRILGRLRGEPRFVEMFIGEAKRAVQLQHANIVQIFSLEEEQGWPFIVMEHVHGKNLHQVVRAAVKEKVGLPIDFGIHCVAEMLKGLSYAHEAVGPDGKPMELIHRDITPENIFVSFSGEVKLSDFGVAHSAGTVGTHRLRGKLGYIAPETLLDVPLDQRSDIFSAGVVLWEVLAQRRLFRGKGPEALTRVLHDTPEPPSRLNPKVASDLDRIVLRALAKDRTQRWQTAQELEEAISDFLFARALRWTRRRIAEVMQARHPDDAEPPELPPELPRTQQGGLVVPRPPDFSDISAEHMLQKLRGALDSEVGHLTEDVAEPSPLPFETNVPESAAAVPVEVDFDEFSTETERVLVQIHGIKAPLPLTLDGLIGKTSDAPDEVEAVGFSDRPPLEREELAQLLLWDALRPLPPLPPEPSIEDSFEQMSPTRLLYEVSVRRLTGNLLLEDPPSHRQRLVLLRDGLPLYVYSNDPAQGLLPMLRRYGLLDPGMLYRGLVKVLCDRRPLDDALTETLREQGKVDAAATVHRFVAGLLMRRLFACFSWRYGGYRAFGEVVLPSPYLKPLPSMLGYLVSAARHAYTSDGLYAMLSGRGERAVVLSPQRESHIAALRLVPSDMRVVEQIDGRRNLPHLILQAGASGPEAQHRALAVLYVLAETHLVELL